MSIVIDFNSVLFNSINDNKLEDASKLILGFNKTDEKPDATTLYLEALYHYETSSYALALIYAEASLKLDLSFEPAKELIRLLTEYEGNFDKYEYAFNTHVLGCERKLRIALFKGENHLIDYTVNMFRKSFEFLGHEVMTLDLNNADKMSEFIGAGVDFALFFNHVGLGTLTRDADGKSNNMWNRLNVRCYDFLFDHPAYYYDTLDEFIDNVTVTCVDKNHVKYVNEFYKGVNRCKFLPLGSEDGVTDNRVSFTERKIDVLFVGSYKENPDCISDELSQKIFEYLKSNPNLTLEDAVRECVYAKGQSIDTEELKHLIEKYRYIDMNVNAYYRFTIVKELVNAGIDVNVYGYGWDTTNLMETPHFHYEGVIGPDECVRLMYDTKIVLNAMPWFKNGSHDRIYNAMMAGALCISDESAYIKEQFEDNKDIVFYELKDLDKLPQLVRYYLNNPELSNSIAENGFQKSVLKNTWTNRAIELIEDYEEIK